MDSVDKFLADYNKNLNAQNAHLSYEELSAFILQDSAFSQKEKNFVIHHLENCTECTSKYVQIFDYEFICTETLLLQTKVLLTTNPDSVVFYSKDKQIELELSIEKSRLRAVFHRLPVHCIGRNISLMISGLPSKNRIVNVQVDEAIYFIKVIELDNNKIETVSIEVGEDLENQNKPETLQAVSFSWHLYAAAAVILLFLGSAVMLYMNQTPEPQITETAVPQKTNSDTVKIVESKKKEPSSKRIDVSLPKQTSEPKILAENFVENPLLENFIDQNYRSANVITDLFPVSGDTLRRPFTFKWKSETTGVIYKISVLNNRNKEVWQQSGGEQTVFLDKALSPGLYYWKLLVNDNLFTVRKFYVLK